MERTSLGADQDAEDADGDLVRADEAERRVIEAVRRIGQETLHSWAEGRIARGEDEQLKAEGVRRAGKKNSAGTPRLAPSR